MMDTKATATLDIAIPQDDGSIAQALNDLERKLTAWSGAIADAHAELERIAAERAAAQHTVVHLAGREPDSAAPIATRPKPVLEIADAQPRVSVTTAPSPPAKAQRETAPDAAPPRPSSVIADRSDRVSLDEETGTADGENPKAATAELPQPDEKELLESLDEETRRAIQLIRRLSPSRPLSELLEIHRASVNSTSESQTKKKSWWKRGTQ
jgi:hypothetical protein